MLFALRRLSLVIVGLLASGISSGCRSVVASNTLSDDSPSPFASPWDRHGVAGRCRNHPLTNIQDQGRQDPPLSALELTTFVRYQDEAYKDINALLRGQPLTAARRRSAAADARRMQGVIERQKPTTENLHVYRSFQTSRPLSEAGKRFTAEGFVSTSLDRDYGNGKTLFGFGVGEPIPENGMVAITIQLPPQMRGFSMNAIWSIAEGTDADECEVILAHGSTYEVVESTVKRIRRGSGFFNLVLQTWRAKLDAGPLPPDVVEPSMALVETGQPMLDAMPRGEGAVTKTGSRLDASADFDTAFRKIP